MKSYALVDSCTRLTSRKPLNATQATTAPVCADDDCMQCAMGLYCPNAPKAAAKPRVRVCLSWTASQLEVMMFEAILSVRANVAKGVKAAMSSITATAHAMASKQFADNAEMIWRSRNPRPQGNSATTRKRQAEYDRKAPAAIAAVRAEAMS